MHQYLISTDEHIPSSDSGEVTERLGNSSNPHEVFTKRPDGTVAVESGAFANFLGSDKPRFTVTLPSQVGQSTSIPTDTIASMKRDNSMTKCTGTDKSDTKGTLTITRTK